MNPKISVIIPVYNVETYIRQCLDSVINQTYQNLEIIIIDDGSPDNCGKICDEYAEIDKRIQVIHKENEGVGAARNGGVDRATGEWIIFIDPDDWCELDYIEELFTATQGQSVDVIISGGCIWEYKGKTIVKKSIKQDFRYNNSSKREEFMIQSIQPIKSNDFTGEYTIGSTWDKMLRLSFLKQNKIQFETALHPTEDTLFSFLVFDLAESVIGCTYIGYHYRPNIHSVTQQYKPDMLGISYRFIDKLYHYVSNRGENKILCIIPNAAAIKEFGRLLRVYYFHKDNHVSYFETVKEIQKLKQMPYFRCAINSKCNNLLTKKQICLKYLLRLPWIWPLKLAVNIRQLLRQVVV